MTKPTNNNDCGSSCSVLNRNIPPLLNIDGKSLHPILRHAQPSKLRLVEMKIHESSKSIGIVTTDTLSISFTAVDSRVLPSEVKKFEHVSNHDRVAPYMNIGVNPSYTDMSYEEEEDLDIYV